MTVARGADLDRGQIGFGDVGNDPDVRKVGDAIELVAGRHALAVDDTLLDHVPVAGDGQSMRARIGARLAHFVDAALGHAEIAQPLHRALSDRVGVRPGGTPRCVARIATMQVDLRQLDLGAVDPEQRLAGAQRADRWC